MGGCQLYTMFWHSTTVAKILYKNKDNIFFSQTQIFTTQTGQRKEDCTLRLQTSFKT